MKSTQNNLITAKNLDEFFVLQGRVYLKDEVLYLNHSSSSIEGKFYGSKLSLNVSALYWQKKYGTYIRVIVDNKPKKILVDSGISAISFSVNNGNHTFKVIKLPESKSCTFGIISILCDGKFIKTVNTRTLNIEVVGDSISTGYGVASKKQDAPYLTIHQNADQSFGYILAQKLSANLNIIGAGGHALYRSRHARTPMPEMYDNVDLDRDKAIWNKNLFKPNVIIVELGTNDFSYLRSLEGNKKESEKHNVKEIFIQFLNRLLTQKCKIIVLFGFYGDEELKNLTLDVINTINNKSISYVETPNIYSIPDVKAGHPGKKSHLITANLLLDHIKQMGIL